MSLQASLRACLCWPVVDVAPHSTWFLFLARPCASLRPCVPIAGVHRPPPSHSASTLHLSLELDPIGQHLRLEGQKGKRAKKRRLHYSRSLQRGDRCEKYVSRVPPPPNLSSKGKTPGNAADRWWVTFGAPTSLALFYLSRIICGAEHPPEFTVLRMSECEALPVPAWGTLWGQATCLLVEIRVFWRREVGGSGRTGWPRAGGGGRLPQTLSTPVVTSGWRHRLGFFRRTLSTARPNPPWKLAVDTGCTAPYPTSLDGPTPPPGPSNGNETVRDFVGRGCTHTHCALEHSVQSPPLALECRLRMPRHLNMSPESSTMGGAYL